MGSNPIISTILPGGEAETQRTLTPSCASSNLALAAIMRNYISWLDSSSDTREVQGSNP